jgi:hypothetical protein
LGVGLTTLHHKNKLVTKNLTESQTWADSLDKRGCETWSLTLREEHRLRVFEIRVLRRIFGQNRDEVTGEWRKLHNNYF